MFKKWTYFKACSPWNLWKNNLIRIELSDENKIEVTKMKKLS